MNRQIPKCIQGPQGAPGVRGPAGQAAKKQAGARVAIFQGKPWLIKTNGVSQGLKGGNVILSEVKRGAGISQVSASEFEVAESQGAEIKGRFTYKTNGPAKISLFQKGVAASLEDVLVGPPTVQSFSEDYTVNMAEYVDCTCGKETMYFATKLLDPNTSMELVSYNVQVEGYDQ